MDYEILLPSKTKIVSEEGNKGVYEIEGLYAGYGYTLGNSLRRIILSSIPGAAVTSVKIEGVPHEFSTIKGVKEDVINIILNIKRLRFKLLSDEPQTLTLAAKGEKTVTAKDIQTPSQVEIMNKDQVIATLTDKSASLKIEMVVEKGLGYVSREALHKEKVDVGTIYLDAVFTPIRRVNYEVEDMRVGDRTDYNRLRFIIETDGSISPKETLEKAIEIMIKHLKAILGFRKEDEELEKELEEIKGSLDEAAEAAGKEEEAEEEDISKIKIEDINLSSRTQNALAEAGIRTIGGLMRKKEKDLRAIEGIGDKAINEIKRVLGNYGLILRQE